MGTVVRANFLEEEKKSIEPISRVVFAFFEAECH